MLVEQTGEQSNTSITQNDCQAALKNDAGQGGPSTPPFSYSLNPSEPWQSIRNVEQRSGNGEKTKDPSLASGMYRILKHTDPIARGKTEMASLPRKQTTPSWCNSNRILSLNCQTTDN